MFTFSEKEYEIVSLIWSEKRPMTSSEIVSLCTDKSWKDSTIHIHINNLLEKGAIEIVGVEKATKTYARLFGVTCSPEEYLAMQVKRSPVYVGSKNEKLTGIVSSLIDDAELSLETITKLEQMLTAKKEELSR